MLFPTSFDQSQTLLLKWKNSTLDHKIFFLSLHGWRGNCALPVVMWNFNLFDSYPWHFYSYPQAFLIHTPDIFYTYPWHFWCWTCETDFWPLKLWPTDMIWWVRFGFWTSLKLKHNFLGKDLNTSSSTYGLNSRLNSAP